MSRILHQAIRDALRDAPGYQERGILVSQFLDATADLSADETLLYRAVYTIFRALPERLMRGSLMLVATEDVEGGIQLTWEGREPADLPHAGDVRDLLRAGPHGDLLEIAMVALERFCQARAGYVETTVERVQTASAFERPPHAIRRVVAFLPRRPVESGPVGNVHPPKAAEVPPSPARRSEGSPQARPLLLTRIRRA